MSEIVTNIFKKSLANLSDEQILAMAVPKQDSVIQYRRDKWYKRKEWYVQNNQPQGYNLSASTPTEKEDTTFTGEVRWDYGGLYYQNYELNEKPGSFVPKHDVIWKRAYNPLNPHHRMYNYHFNPWYGVEIKKKNSALSYDRPKFLKPGTEDDPDPEEHEGCVEAYSKLRLREAFRKALDKGDVGGATIYYPFEEQFEGYTAPNHAVYTWNEVSGAKAMEYKKGFPIKFKIRPTNRKIPAFDLDISECVYFDHTNSDDHMGIPYGMETWYERIALLFIMAAFTEYDQRLGSGFIIVICPPGAKQAVEDSIRNNRTEKGMVIERDLHMTGQDPVQIEWQDAASQVDFVAHIEKLEGNIIRNTGYPKRWWQGDEEGAMESSGKDKLQVNVKHKENFQPWEMWWKLVMKFHGVIENVEDIVVRPGFEMSYSEEERLEQDLLKTQDIGLKTWLTINEQRELDGYEPMDEEGADDLFPPMDVETSESGPDGSNSSSQRTIDRSKVDAVIEFVNEFSLNKQVPILGISKPQVQKMRHAVNELKKPKVKLDEYEIKEDSVAVSETLYEIRDVPLVLPQTKEYNGRNCVRSPESIKEAWEDPKTPRSFRLGVSSDDGHPRKIPLEITSEDGIGTVELTRLGEDGAIYGNYIIDIEESRRILGNDNWLERTLQKRENPNTSIALRSIDYPESDGTWEERDLDIRSFVVTQSPRNKKAGK
jgi:hypothetical protein